ncbi:TetR/AcrR family transcriptional regulator [Mammaliicoccus fleurettii]|nr:TetR/AcrR family transcriptional regulator [Mammaliicoccus fleurettii]
MNNTSEKLIQISMRTFSEKGYYGTSLNNIANDLGVKKSSLYNYIKSKDDLYGICLEKCMKKGLSLIENINTQTDNLHEELLSFLRRYINDSDYMVKFYLQLSFAPCNFTKDIEEYNDKFAVVFSDKLRQIHSYNQLKIDQDDFVLFVNMFVNGWLYKKAFVKSATTPKKIIKEFEQQANLLLDSIQNKEK